MHTVHIPYVDYLNDDKPSTEVFNFNLTSYELAKITVEFPEGLDVFMNRALKENNLRDTFMVIEMLIVRGYGRKQEADGRVRFFKKPEWLQYLLPSPEFEALYNKLNEDTKFAIEFWNKLVSPDLLKKAKELEETSGAQAGPKMREMTLEQKVAALQAELAQKNAANEI